MTDVVPKSRKRSDYVYFLSYRTRWSDNDQYHHLNNAVYYHLYDSIINDYLARYCNINSTTSELIGLVVSSYSYFFRSLSFPRVLELGLRVVKIGKRSVTYEVGVFDGLGGEDVGNSSNETAAVVGGYTHVFVETQSRKSVDMSGVIRRGLEELCTVSSKL